MTSNPFDSQEFRNEFEKTIDKKLTNVTAPIVALLQKHDKRLDDNEKKTAEHTNKFREQRGAMWAFGVCGTAIVTAFEGALHFFSKK